MSDDATPGEPRDGHSHEECYACPVGGLFLTARQGGPEAFEHLLNAASELVAAARSLVDAAERAIDHQRAAGRSTAGGDGGTPSRVRRIDLA